MKNIKYPKGVTIDEFSKILSEYSKVLKESMPSIVDIGKHLSKLKNPSKT